jgi:hypothetical protein
MRQGSSAEYAFKLKEAKLKAAPEAAEAKCRSENEDWNTWGGYYYRDGRVVRRRARQKAKEKVKDMPRLQPVKPRPRAPKGR